MEFAVAQFVRTGGRRALDAWAAHVFRRRFVQKYRRRFVRGTSRCTTSVGRHY
jgi:hypothetical protein